LPVAIVVAAKYHNPWEGEIITMGSMEITMEVDVKIEAGAAGASF
jgi:hypothetical protein